MSKQKKKQEITEEMCCKLASMVVTSIKGSRQEATSIGGKLLWKHLKGAYIPKKEEAEGEEVAAGSGDG